MPWRVLIVDDNSSFLAASRSILCSPELNVVGEALTATDALERVAELRPDVVLLDIELGDESGIDVARRLGESGGAAAPHMIFISAHLPEEFADIVDESPALGFIPKTELSAGAVDELLRTHGAAVSESDQRESK